MARGRTLVSKVSADLRQALAQGEYQPGQRLPTEADLAVRYAVSRPTVRAALRELEALSLVRTQHGVGTFVADRPAIRAGLERMDSITDSIRAQGREPGIEYQSLIVRPLLPDELQKMHLPAGSEAVEVRRTILADGEIVAYSYDLIPVELFGVDHDPLRLEGSLFEYFRTRLGLYPHRGIAEIHAVSSDRIGWGADVGKDALYVLLDQLHYDDHDRLLLYSRTYFLEGKYAFTIVRSN